MAKNWEEYLKENVDRQRVPQWKQYIADHIPPARAGEFDPVAAENGMFNLPEIMEDMSARKNPVVDTIAKAALDRSAKPSVFPDIDPMAGEAGIALDDVAAGLNKMVTGGSPMDRLRADPGNPYADDFMRERPVPVDLRAVSSLPQAYAEEDKLNTFLSRVAGQTAQSVAGLYRMGMEHSGLGNLMPNALGALEDLSKTAEKVQDTRTGYDTQTGAQIGEDAMNVGSSIAQMLMTGATPYPLTAMGLMSAGQSYDANRNLGVSPGTAFAAAGASGFSEGGFERLFGIGEGIQGIKSALRNAGRTGLRNAAGGIGRGLVNIAAGEEPSELMTTLVQGLADRAVDPLHDTGGMNKEMWDTARVTAEQAGLLGLLGGGVNVAGRMADRRYQRQVDQQMAQRRALEALDPKNAQLYAGTPPVSPKPEQTEQKDFLSRVVTELEKIRRQNEQQVQARQWQAQRVEPQEVNLPAGLFEKMQTPAQVPENLSTRLTEPVTGSPETPVQVPSEPVVRRQEPVAETARPEAEPEQNVSENPLDVIVANGGISRSTVKNDLGWTDAEIAKLPEGVVRDDGKALSPVKRALKQAGLDTDVNAILDAAARPEAPEVAFAPEDAQLFQTSREGEAQREISEDSRRISRMLRAEIAKHEDDIVLQNRNRSTPQAIVQMNDIAANPDYGRLSVSRDFANGAPVVFGETGQMVKGKQAYAVDSTGRRIPVTYAVVDADDLITSNRADGTAVPDYAKGIPGKLRVIAGNGRIAGIQEAYNRGTTGKYVQELMSDTDHGVPTGAITDMKKPVLVRIMPSDQVTPNIGDVSNTSGTAALSPLEQAKNDARRVDISSMLFGENGISAQNVRDFIKAMPISEQVGMMTPDGQPTRQAHDRLMAAVFQAAYEDEQLVNLYAQATDPESKNVLNGLALAAHKMSMLKDAGEFDIRGLVTEAAMASVNAARRGEKLSDYAKTIDINRSEDADPIIRMFSENIRSANKIGESLGKLADGMMNALQSQDSMFGDAIRRPHVFDKWRQENGLEQGSEGAVQKQTGTGVAENSDGRRKNDPTGSADHKGTARTEQPEVEGTGERKIVESGFELEATTPEQLRRQEEQRQLQERQKAENDLAFDRKEAADRERDRFVLTGSDRDADVLAAHGQESLFDGQKKTPVPAKETAVPDHETGYGTLENPDTFALSGHFKAQFESGRKYGNINQARAEVADLLGVSERTKLRPIYKQIDESIELGLVRAARDIVSEDVKNHIPAVETYRKMVRLYQDQPNLGTRTSTSVAQQAYSTPLPLSFLASRLAGIDSQTIVYEPSAGNGALLMAASPENAIVNELNPDRAERLKRQGFSVTQKDASGYTPSRTPDVVIANPPFGTVKDDNGNTRHFNVLGLDTTEIDQAISLQALDTLPEDGRAVLIIGGKQGNDKARSAKYNTAAQRAFYKTLFDHFNVVDHFSVDGKLYNKQGAGYPIDFIVIDGHYPTENPVYPAGRLPQVYTSFEALEEKLNGDEGAEIRRERTDSQPVHGRRRDQIEIPSSERNGVEDGRTAGKRTGKRPVDDLQTVAGQSGESRRDDVPVEERTGRRHAADDSGSARRDGQSGVDQLPAGQPRVPAETTAAGGRRESGRTDSGRNDVGNDAAQRRLDVNKPKKSTAKGTETQRPYQTHSNGYQLGTLVPANMETPVRRALENVAGKHGDLDAFVARELGYDSVESMQGAFAAEQVDALSLALDNIGDGKGFILGDQTGIGKGRVCAGIIRWAKQNGKTPIFVTMLPDLYADMMRDLRDIGTTDFTPFITNRNMTGKNALVAPDGSKLAAPSGRKYDTVVADILSGKKLPEGYDAIFTTYKQLQSQKGKTNARQDILNALSDNAILILDEAHNAGGAESSIGQFIRSYTANMKNGVLYSSATFAKRPDIMSLYNKTDISKIGDQKKIQEITEKGGLPIQQAISAMLTESGQYIRREKSFEGASMDTVPVNVDIRTSDRISAAMEKIMFFSSVFQNTVEEISKDLKMAGRASGMKKGVGNVGATSTSFGSVMHNLVSVSTMASKVEATIDAVERAVRNGEKPVVTLSNTLGSAIEEYARKNGLKNGEKIDLNFRDLIGTYLEKTRTIRVTEPGASESKDYYVKDKEMGSVALEAYRAARRYIDKLDISLPVSPIDAIKDGLARKGIRAGEITGRSHGVSYETDTPSYRTREPSVAEKQKAAIGFNAGDLDCLIINQSGSTGISLHASEKFADQRRRNMIILQPDLNIDVFMQTLGRVFRTGQVVPPKYSFLLSDIPSERRPAAVLGKKMSSLNANTTASAKGTQSFANIPDFLNVYGDQAAAQVLSEDAELNARLGHPWSAEDKVLDGLVARMTGRIPLLSAKEQSDVYDRLESAYKDIIDLANATGTNILDTTSKPLDAREISEKVFSEGRKTGSPFDTESVAVTYDVKRLGKPFRSEEVKKHIAEGEKSPVRVSELEAQWRDFRDSRDGNVEFPSEARNRITNVAARLHVGAPVRVNTSNGTTVGIVVGIQNTNKKGQNPYALSRWKLVIDLADAKRRISIPFSKISMSESATEDKFSVVPFTGKSIDELYRDFDEGQSESRENRTIIIGNLVRAFDATKGRGEIITFDTSDGNRIAGLMLPRGVSETKLMEERAVPFETGNQAIRYFDRVRNTELSTEDGNLRLDNHYGYHLRTPSAKAVGGKYYLDPAILDITGDFVKSGNFMRVGLNTSQVKKIVELMAARKNPLQAEMSRDVAREVTGQGKTENAKSEPVKYSRSERQDRGMSVDELRLLADTLVESFHNAPGIVVADRPQDAIPDALPDGMGLFDPNNGKVFLFARNIRDADTARAVFAHEVIAHYGLRGFFGDSLGDVLVSIRNHNPKIEKLSQEWWSENQDYIKQVRENEGRNWTEDQFEKWQRDISIEEAMAFFAEQGERITGVKRLVRKIQELLRDITRRLGWRWPANLANWLESKTDAEALSALHQAELFVRGEISGQTVTTQRDIAKYRVRESEEARTGVFDESGSFAVPQISVLDNIIRAMQDKDIDIRRVQDSILKSGGEISESQDVYLNETLYTSRMSDRLRRLNEAWTKPILDAVHESGLTLDEAGDWLYARHVVLDGVNAKLAEINPDREDNEALSGMSDDEAQDILARNKDNKGLEKLGDLSDKLARRNVMWLVNGGLLTKEEGKAWISKYEHYVPLKRDSDIPEKQRFVDFVKNPLGSVAGKPGRRGKVSGTRNMETRGNESKRRMGGTSRATNIIGNMIANATTTVMRIEKAIVGRSMLDLARANPNPDLWTVDIPEKVKRINRRTGLVEVTYRDLDMVPADNVLVVKENGVEHWIRFNKDNPRAMAIAKSMKGMDAAAVNWLIRSIGNTTRYMARWITSRNPVFMLFNMQRDIQHAMFNLSDTPLSGKEWQVLKNILPAMRQYHNLLRGNGEKAGYADEFREAGAETGFVKTFESIHDHVRDLQKDLDKMSRSKANPMTYIEKTVQAIDDYNAIVENGVRLAVYTVARENGRSIRQAAKIAKEITVDFNRRGTYSGFINSLYMFTNASIQGHARLFRALKKSKKARVMAAGLVGLGFVMDMVGRALLGDDDETGLKVWDEIPEWDKERYWIVPAPWSRERYIKVPMPQGLHILPNIGRMLSELCFSSRKKDPLDMALRASLLMVDAFNPFGAASSPGQFIAPTVAKPVVQLSENRSFAGQKVFREETPYGGYTPPAYRRAWSNTPEHWIRLSRMFNDVTGGDDVMSGRIDIPPEAIRLIVNSYLLPGTSGNVDKLAGALQKDETTSKDWPILSRMYGTAPDEREKERMVYDRIGKNRSIINAIREYEKQGRWDDADRAIRRLGDGDYDLGIRRMKMFDDTLL